VKRLQRNILPDGICARDDVELLLALDRVVSRADRTWGDYLVAAVTDFVVWGERPTGYVDADAGRWLNGLLLAGEPTRTAVRIAREVEQEAHQAEALATGMPLAPAVGDGIAAVSAGAFA
jgi:hypothetical protein